MLRVESGRTVIGRDRYNSGSKKNLKKNLFRSKKNKIKDKKITVVVGVKY